MSMVQSGQEEENGREIEVKGILKYFAEMVKARGIQEDNRNRGRV